MKVMIGIAALGGVILTSYMHGDTDMDRGGIQMLNRIAKDYLIVVPVLAAGGFLFAWFRKRKTLPAVNTHKFPVKKI